MHLGSKSISRIGAKPQVLISPSADTEAADLTEAAFTVISPCGEKFAGLQD
jgi:hypothetical protein